MSTVWAQRREELLSDCIVFPDVFNQMVDRLGEFVVPYQHALETEAGQHPMHLYLQGLLSHLQRKNAEDIATWVDVERQVIQDFIGTAPWDHRPLVTVLVGQVAERLGEPDGIIAGVVTEARSTTAKLASSWGMSPVTTMPYSTSACPSLRSGPETRPDARSAMCPRRCGITRVRSSAWRCSRRGVLRCPMAG